MYDPHICELIFDKFLLFIICILGDFKSCISVILECFFNKSIICFNFLSFLSYLHHGLINKLLCLLIEILNGLSSIKSVFFELKVFLNSECVNKYFKSFTTLPLYLSIIKLLFVFKFVNSLSFFNENINLVFYTVLRLIFLLILIYSNYFSQLSNKKH